MKRMLAEVKYLQLFSALLSSLKQESSREVPEAVAFFNDLGRFASWQYLQKECTAVETSCGCFKNNADMKDGSIHAAK